MTHTARRSFDVTELTRVEGEGALVVSVEGDRIADLRLRIFEPPRFFETLLVGRGAPEVSDIVARICGICPVAYQTSSANALESVLGIEPSVEVGNLRRMLYLAEWIESHALHVYLLHAPDFLGFPSGIDLARVAPEAVGRGLRLKRIGNDLMAAIGGREIHPVAPRLGGFWSAPDVGRLAAFAEDLDWALEAALETVRWTSEFTYPDLEQDYEFVALSDPDEYAVIDGRLHSTGGIDAPVAEWNNLFEEEQVEWSNALHCRIRGRGAYLTGPMARYALNGELLHPIARDAASRAGLGRVERNPFKSIIVRSVEMVHAAATLKELTASYRPPVPPFREAPMRAGEGHGASEAPRGLLYHRYRIDDGGIVVDAQIVPPTSQNQLRIEHDLRALIPGILGLSDDEIQILVEQAVRNHDPCISCATHFLDIRLERRGP